jgi:hypothetical protein
MSAANPTVVTLELPLPPSVNQTRRLDAFGNRARHQFYLRTDLHLSAYGPQPAPVRKITGRYAIAIQIPEHSRLDLDNHCKVLLDYLVSREFVAGDDKRYLRRLTIEWVDAEQCPLCHVTITGTP